MQHKVAGLFSIKGSTNHNFFYFLSSEVKRYQNVRIDYSLISIAILVPPSGALDHLAPFLARITEVICSQVSLGTYYQPLISKPVELHHNRDAFFFFQLSILLCSNHLNLAFFLLCFGVSSPSHSWKIRMKDFSLCVSSFSALLQWQKI